MRGPVGALLVLGLAASPAGAPAPSPSAPAGWVSIDYGGLVDRRQLSHSGEPVGALLRQLDGRTLPGAGERPEDRLSHALLDPLLEPYAFVLSDALDTLGAIADPPLVEIGGLWQSGEAQPTWVELLRARRYVAESDGKGRMRFCLPLPASGPVPGDPRAAAEQAWQAAWPVVRHVVAAERRRLAQGGVAPPTAVAVHAYRHAAERSQLLLGTRPFEVSVADTRPSGLRPPLDLAALGRFLASGLELEGARLEAGGQLRLLGSEVTPPPTILGRPLELGDLAAAYRAVVYGGLAEPYMSLDRGFSPQTSIVNYGGRLRDTGLGLVSLFCDIRFKTFSLGLDIVTGDDVRSNLRARLPTFRTHLERLAAHPQSEGMAGQQTRLWFYPDSVDLTLAPQGDLIVMRRARMAAASERVQLDGPSTARREDPPWTRSTVEAINRDYAELGQFFPELADLDRVVRLLSLFTWLRQAEADGLLVPELAALLAVEQPALTTPRAFPQLLAFNALPAPGATSAVEAFDRVPVGEALERLGPSTGLVLPASRRFARALSALDAREQQQAVLLEELRRLDPGQLDEGELDLLAHRAERLRMHQLVLATLEAPRAKAVAERQSQGERLRVFSVGIGGLDLGMGPALARARSQGAGGASAADRPGAAPRAVTEPREAWRADPGELPPVKLPDHGLRAARTGSQEGASHWVEAGAGTLWTVHGAQGPEPTSRRLTLDGNRRVSRIERVEGSRFLAYRLDAKGSELTAILEPRASSAAEAATLPGGAIPAGLALMTVESTGVEAPVARVKLVATVAGARKELVADLPRPALARLILGREVDLTPGQALPGLAPLPAALGDVRTLMVLLNPAQRVPPWTGLVVPVPGEESPAHLAAALDAWWGSERGGWQSAVVGVDAARSPARWQSAPATVRSVLLLAPPSAFPGIGARRREELVAAWKGETAGDALPARVDADLVLLVSAESPGLFAERLRLLERNPALAGKLVAAWSFAGPVRTDLPAAVLGGGGLAGLGLAGPSLVAERHAARQLRVLAEAVAQPGAVRRAEQLPGPFVWYF